MVNKDIVFFDGVCNLCNSSVQWIIKNEKKPVLSFAPLQGTTAREILGDKFTEGAMPQSVLLFSNGNVLVKSAAAFGICAFLKVPFKWLQVLRFIPSPLSDLVYDFIARNRYRWFGKKDACMIPTPELKQRFLP